MGISSLEGDMSSQVLASTARLRLVPFGNRRLTPDYVVGWLKDHELMRFSEQRDRVQTPESSRDYVRSFREQSFVAKER
jgi:hypothetical protein